MNKLNRDCRTTYAKGNVRRIGLQASNSGLSRRIVIPQHLVPDWAIGDDVQFVETSPGVLLLKKVVPEGA